MTGSRQRHRQGSRSGASNGSKSRFDVVAERGIRRDDIRPGLRIVGFERRVTIAFTAEPERVVILRVMYGGRNWEADLSNDEAGPST